MRHLHWFRNDLRLNDNPALASHAAADSLLCLYLMPNPRPWCNLNGIGKQRDRFLRESLIELKAALNKRGQDLLVLEGSPELVIPHIVERFGITEISVSREPGFYESQTIEFLEERLSIPIITHRGNSLFAEDELPMPLEDLPGVFSPFRRKVEKSCSSESLWTRSSIYRRHQRHNLMPSPKRPKSPHGAAAPRRPASGAPSLEAVYLR